MKPHLRSLDELNPILDRFLAFPDDYFADAVLVDAAEAAAWRNGRVISPPAW